MGNVTSWLAQWLYPEDQMIWQAARAGDVGLMRSGIARLTPETRRRLEWQEPCSGRTPIAEASAKGHSECARLLIQAGANCNVKDYRGDTPLHLACKSGKPATVQLLLHVPNLFPFETNLRMKTPLDIARDRFAREEERQEMYEECIELLEKRFCLYSGWLYEKTDNVLSFVSGISSLNSWTRRFCIVLERGAPDILELALFSMRPSKGLRPVCPASVVLYHVGVGMELTTDTKWFNRKEHAFVLQGCVRDKDRLELAMAMKPLEFAAVDQAGFSAWKKFFEYQQQQLASRGTTGVAFRTAGRVNRGAPTGPLTQVPQIQPAWSEGVNAEASPATPAIPINPSSVPPAQARSSHTDAADQEDEDLKRAIMLSLQTAPPNAIGSAFPTDMACSPELPVSAPDWEDDSLSCDANDYSPPDSGANASTDSDNEHTIDSATSSTTADAAPSPPVVNFGQAPTYSSIGECVICFDGPQSAVCVPCGHNAVCMSCAEEILETTCECPVCREPIRELIKLYRV